MATRQVPMLTVEAAKIAAEAAEKKAKEMGIGTALHPSTPPFIASSVPNALSVTDFNIALVDSTLHLLHFTRMPAAKLTSVSIAIDKAFTAAGHRLPTAAYNAENSPFKPGGPGFGISGSNGGRFMIIGGGLPITVDGVVVGGIGVSTGTPKQDAEVAQAGVEAIEAFVRRKGGAKL